MFRNYLKIASRNILRNKVHAFVNITGLSLGICACIAIYLVVHYEMSFDKHHPGSSRIYRVMTDYTESTGGLLHFNRTSPEVSTMGRTELSGVEMMAGVIPVNAKITIEGSDKKFESRLPGLPYRTTAFTEPEYFKLFQYKWLAGARQTALTEPFRVVLTESRARLYFGNIDLQQMIGRQVIYNDSLRIVVSGILADPQENTDLMFTDFISFSTIRDQGIIRNTWKNPSWNAWVFARLEKGSSVAGVEKQLNALAKKRAGDVKDILLKLEPLSMMHFNADVIENVIRTAHKPTLYTESIIAAFILVLAIMNFINLSTAQSLQRAKEVSIRKVLGSKRSLLVMQFMTETGILTFVAVLLAALLVQPVLSVFSKFIPEGVSFNIANGSTWLFLVSVFLVTTLLAGLYPARLISAQMVVWTMKNFGSPKGEKWWLRKGLIVFQFTVSLIFIIGSLVISQQLAFTREKDLGFTSNAIITIESPRGEDFRKMALLKQSLQQMPSVQQVARQWLSPMSDNPRAMQLKFKKTDVQDFEVTQVAGDENFLPLYHIQLLAGRNLTASDTVNEFVINESLSRIIGDSNPQASLNNILYWNGQPYPVVGVVKDFHTASLHDPITPLCIINRPDREFGMAVKISGSIKNTLSEIETAWKKIYPAAVFSFRFYDETLAQLYEKDRQTATLVNMSTAITIFISCIGLFGLALFTARKKAKEISIRKVLGAGVANIVMMLGREFLIPVLIALFIAAPVAWYFMNEWLQGFAYRISMNGWVIVVAGFLAVGIAVVTVGLQAVRAGMVSPLKDLRE